MAQINVTKTVKEEMSIPECEPVYLYEQVPVEKKMEVIKEVVDTACQDEYTKMKTDLQSLIYSACQQQNKYCEYLY